MARIPRVTMTLMASLLLGACQFFQGPAHGAAGKVQSLGQASHCGYNSPQLVLLRKGDSLPALRGKLRETLNATLEEGHLVLLVALGERPTPGYGAELDRVEVVSGDRLSLHLNASKPEEGSLLAQVITTPCLALSLPEGGWSALTVELPVKGFPITRPHP
ncbi:MAG: protease complex subunit PrcB family protein [Oleiphilaceae bacterium]|nr:protease complex subunit PrcB family protein [Oleiphilaceae bacterium]